MLSARLNWKILTHRSRVLGRGQDQPYCTDPLMMKELCRESGRDLYRKDLCRVHSAAMSHDPTLTKLQRLIAGIRLKGELPERCRWVALSPYVDHRRGWLP